jgi:hypothetical protein
MINQELMETSRLLVAAVQDSDNFTVDFLRKLILKFVPMLLGEIEILSGIAEQVAGKLGDPADIASIEVVMHEAAATMPKKGKHKPKKKRKGGRKQ